MFRRFLIFIIGVSLLWTTTAVRVQPKVIVTSEMSPVIDTELLELSKRITSQYHLRDLLQDDQRNNRLFVDHAVEGVILDMTRQLITSEAFDKLLQHAKEIKLSEKIQKMFSGEILNFTEKRPVLHTALRSPKSEVVNVNGKNVIAEVHEVLQKIQKFTNEVRNGKRLGHTGKPLTDIVCVGIGGSFLGPEFVYEALRTDKEASAAAEGRKLRFLANVDPIDVQRALDGLNPETTMVIVVSKTFTTAETMLNAKTCSQWLLRTLKDPKAIASHVVAVSTNIAETTNFGISPDNVFGFWDWVGGRYSVTSAVGVVPLSLHYGYPIVQQFLNGAHQMDIHFRSAPLEGNLPILMGLIAHWNSVYLGHPTLAVLPYCQALLRFSAHIQQLNMESNGKSVTSSGEWVTYPTGPVIFGEPGTNGQHSFYQLMHQGAVVPAEFIGFAVSQNPVKLEDEPVSNHDELMSNFFAQPDALAIGKTVNSTSDGIPEALVKHKTFRGNRPSTVLLLPVCNAFHIGSLLALYEHRTVVEGFLLDINSFDQWGVELGKQLAKDVRSYLATVRGGDTEQSQSILKSFSKPTQKLLKAYVKRT